VTLSEALKLSRLNGRAFQRPGVPFRGWVRYDAEHTYEFSAADLMADDWIWMGDPPSIERCRPAPPPEPPEDTSHFLSCERFPYLLYDPDRCLRCPYCYPEEESG
jgi:hypothetical protein